jgi:hypothetical protein
VVHYHQSLLKSFTQKEGIYLLNYCSKYKGLDNKRVTSGGSGTASWWTRIDGQMQ